MYKARQDGYVKICRRCGREFISRRGNDIYCDMPGPFVGDNGRTCKVMAKAEWQAKRREEIARQQEGIASGQLVRTSRYGIITRSKYFDYYSAWLSDKLGIRNDYGEIMKWRSSHPEEDGEHADEFREYAGVVFNMPENR